MNPSLSFGHGLDIWVTHERGLSQLGDYKLFKADSGPLTYMHAEPEPAKGIARTKGIKGFDIRLDCCHPKKLTH
jgi:hypothetical protein